MSTPQVREAIEKITNVLAGEPQKARSKNPTAVASLEAGLRFRISGPNGEAAATDMSPSVGGNASAPTPGWLFRASFASCNATVIAMRAAQLGLMLKTLEVTVTSESDIRGLLGIDDNVSAGLKELRVHVKIGADGANPQQMREIVDWAMAHSPIGCTVRETQTDMVEIEIV
jgi:uncharacterized OsmC-like protein